MDKNSKFWQTKEFLAGIGGTTAVILFIVLSLIQPMVVENTYAINENKVQLGKIDTNLENIQNTLSSLDSRVEKLDAKIDRQTLIICEYSKGQYCD